MWLLVTWIGAYLHNRLKREEIPIQFLFRFPV